jgi:predicted Zn-dependent protease
MGNPLRTVAFLVPVTLLALRCAVALGSPTGEPATGPSAEQVTLIEEANRLEARIAEQGVLHGDPDLDLYLLKITDRLVLAQAGAEDPPALRIRATGGIAPLALSLANGAIYVSVGLLACLENEAQVATVIAGEVARVLSREDERRLQDDRSRTSASFLPELLNALVLGLAERQLRQQEVAAQRAYEERLDDEADAAGLVMLRRAGYLPAEAPQVFTNLLALAPSLVKEPKGNYADPARLEARRSALAARVAALGDAERAAGEAGVDGFAGFRRDLLLTLAGRLGQADRAAEGRVLLDRRDAAFGADGKSAYLRADLARRSARSPAEQDAARQALVAATTYPDVPVQAFRELGFAHRRRGEVALARAAFAEYLRRSPEAVDAPIVRSYLEEP